MTVSVDNPDILIYNSDIMKEYKEYSILEFAGIDFPFWIDKGMHTKPYSPHTHNFIELEIILSGSADHIVEGKTYHIKKGDVLVIMPSYVHELRNVNKLELYNFKFDLDKLILLDTEIEKLSGFQALFILQPFDKYQHDYTSFLSLDEEKLSNARMLSELMLDEWREKKAGYRLSIKSYLLALITFLSRNYSPSLTCTSPKIPYIVHTVNYIHDNFTNKITLSSLAARACLSERQYSRIFREVYGISPIDYVINCRLSLACRLLKNTKLPLTEISQKCGFGDKVSFSRLFSKKYGISPGKYRNL
jgi:AraC-like DNA-binding protein